MSRPIVTLLASRKRRSKPTPCGEISARSAVISRPSPVCSNTAPCCWSRGINRRLKMHRVVSPHLLQRMERMRTAEGTASILLPRHTGHLKRVLLFSTRKVLFLAILPPRGSLAATSGSTVEGGTQLRRGAGLLCSRSRL